MKKICWLAVMVLLLCSGTNTYAGTAPDSLLPVRGFCIAAPKVSELEAFLTFIRKELAPNKVNTLVLRVDYNYQYTSHPELRDAGALSREDVARLVKECRQQNIRIIPQVNLLGHQSWDNTTLNLLRVYPEFDETPEVKMPATYKWPNPEGLYCKSYCPLHPGVHKIVFALMDEICDAFETDAFHAGMDEVFYIGNDKCPRCGGKDKAELFAGEVWAIRNHLAQKNRELWMWGDRLLDGKTTGLGMWEASMNNTHRAIDLIPRDVVICDWHYERPDKTPVYFAMKGLRVITCPWRMPDNAVVQAQDMMQFRKTATREMKPNYLGMMQTVWSGAGSFMDEYYGRKNKMNAMEKDTVHTSSKCFRALFAEINKAR